MKIIKRIIGIVLIITAIIGLTLSLYGISRIWDLQRQWTANTLDAVDLVLTFLETSEEAFTVAEDSLSTASENLITINATSLTLAQSINDTVPVIDTVATVMQEDVPETLEAAKTSLDSAQSSAQLIDSMLELLSSIPFFPGEPYNPEVPLHIALSDVSTSIEDLPEVFSTIGAEMEESTENISLLEDDIINMSATISDINTIVEDATSVTAKYKKNVSKLKTQIAKLKTSIPNSFRKIAWYSTILFSWIALTQIGLITQGLELIGRET